MFTHRVSPSRFIKSRNILSFKQYEVCSGFRKTKTNFIRPLHVNASFAEHWISHELGRGKPNLSKPYCVDFHVHQYYW